MGIEVLIIEDEKLAEEKLRMLLEQCQVAVEVKGACGSVADAVKWLS